MRGEELVTEPLGDLRRRRLRRHHRELVTCDLLTERLRAHRPQGVVRTLGREVEKREGVVERHAARLEVCLRSSREGEQPTSGLDLPDGLPRLLRDTRLRQPEQFELLERVCFLECGEVPPVVSGPHHVQQHVRRRLDVGLDDDRHLPQTRIPGRGVAAVTVEDPPLVRGRQGTSGAGDRVSVLLEHARRCAADLLAAVHACSDLPPDRSGTDLERRLDAHSLDVLGEHRDVPEVEARVERVGGESVDRDDANLRSRHRSDLSCRCGGRSRPSRRRRPAGGGDGRRCPARTDLRRSCAGSRRGPWSGVSRR